MKYADKSGFAYTVVLGDDEIAQKRATLKRMSDGESVVVELDELINYLK